jgi:hypothetical protein
MEPLLTPLLFGWLQMEVWEGKKKAFRYLMAAILERDT